MQTQYANLDTYLNLAKKTISKFGHKFYNGLSSEMLCNNDAVSDVATAIMYADWRFDPSRTGKSGQKKTLYSYRNQCAIWAIKTYISNKYKKKKDMSLDFESDTDGAATLNSTIPDDRALSPLDILIEKENKLNISQSIEDLLNNSLLSDKQKTQIKMYYFDNQTLSAIGKKFGISREAVRQNIKRAIDIIKSYDKVSN
jgi:RNA polymerase sigma factor (sigma-70 family)